MLIWRLPRGFLLGPIKALCAAAHYLALGCRGTAYLARDAITSSFAFASRAAACVWPRSFI